MWLRQRACVASLGNGRAPRPGLCIGQMSVRHHGTPGHPTPFFPDPLLSVSALSGSVTFIVPKLSDWRVVTVSNIIVLGRRQRGRSPPLLRACPVVSCTSLRATGRGAELSSVSGQRQLHSLRVLGSSGFHSGHPSLGTAFTSEKPSLPFQGRGKFRQFGLRGNPPWAFHLSARLPPFPSECASKELFVA